MLQPHIAANANADAIELVGHGFTEVDAQAEREDVQVRGNVSQFVAHHRQRLFAGQVPSEHLLANIGVFTEFTDHGLKPVRVTPVGAVGLRVRRLAVGVLELRESCGVGCPEIVESESPSRCARRSTVSSGFFELVVGWVSHWWAYRLSLRRIPTEAL
jgi:hypothetical protein